MNKEQLFAENLEKVKALAKEQNSCISKQQVEELFTESELSEEQMQMVYDYLIKHKIGIDEPVNLDDYLSDDEVDYLKQYEMELKELPQYSEGEKAAITLSAMAGDTNAQANLVEIYLPSVVEVSKLYSGQGVFLEDLVGEGNVALTQGVTMLGCLEHANEAEGMLMKLIMDAMEDFIAEDLKEQDKTKKVLAKAKAAAKKAQEQKESEDNRYRSV